MSYPFETMYLPEEKVWVVRDARDGEIIGGCWTSQVAAAQVARDRYHSENDARRRASQGKEDGNR